MWITGDVGKVDGEGNLYITDRLKDVFKVKGFQVSPAELEDVLCGCPLIADAGVTSIYVDTDASEWPKAYVVPNSAELVDAITSGSQQYASIVQEFSDKIKAYTEERLIDYKKLRGGLVFLTRIPKSPAGKIL